VDSFEANDTQLADNTRVQVQSTLVVHSIMYFPIVGLCRSLCPHRASSPVVAAMSEPALANEATVFAKDKRVRHDFVGRRSVGGRHHRQQLRSISCFVGGTKRAKEAEFATNRTTYRRFIRVAGQKGVSSNHWLRNTLDPRPNGGNLDLR
jgi:hypothetical protein